MSAVTITLAELAVEAMHDAGVTHAMVDNGGDVALINNYGLKRRVTDKKLDEAEYRVEKLIKKGGEGAKRK